MSLGFPARASARCPARHWPGSATPRSAPASGRAPTSEQRDDGLHPEQRELRSLELVHEVDRNAVVLEVPGDLGQRPRTARDVTLTARSLADPFRPSGHLDVVVHGRRQACERRVEGRSVAVRWRTPATSRSPGRDWRESSAHPRHRGAARTRVPGRPARAVCSRSPMPSSTAGASPATQSASSSAGNRRRNSTAMSFAAGGAGKSFAEKRPISSWTNAFARGNPVSHSRPTASSSRSVERSNDRHGQLAFRVAFSTCRKNLRRVAGAAAPSASDPPRARIHARRSSIHCTREPARRPDAHPPRASRCPRSCLRTRRS